MVENLCTCLCQSYVMIANIVALVCGTVLELFTLYVLLWNPMGEMAQVFVDEGDLNTKAFTDELDVGKAKMGMLFAGIFMIVAGSIGICFASQKNRQTGLCYLGLLVLALIVSAVGVGMLFGTAAHIEKLNEMTGQPFNVSVAEKKFEAASYVAKQEFMAKLYKSFFKRLKSEDYWCRPTNWPKPAMLHERFQTSAQGEELLVSLASARALTDDTPPPEYRGPSEEEREAAYAKGARHYCMASQMAITCEKKPFVGDMMTKYCWGRSESTRKEFTESCNGCALNYFDNWNVSKNMDPEDAHQWRDWFHGEAGIMFCRCFSGVLDIATRHAASIAKFGLAFAIAQAVLLFSVCWLIMCGPESKAQGPVPSSQTIEMNIGQQPPRGWQGATRIQVMCPMDSGPGLPVLITAPDGRKVQALVPAGVSPGMMFQVTV